MENSGTQTHMVEVPSNVDDMIGVSEIAKKYEALYENTVEIFHKVNCHMDNFDSYLVEIDCMKKLEDSGFTPKLIDGQILAKVECIKYIREHRIASVYYITLTRMQNLNAKSLSELYIPENKRHKYLGPGTFMSANNDNLDDIKSLFPTKYIPSNVTDEVIRKLKILFEKYGIYHEDIHPGNFLELDGKIFVVDFECVTIV